MCHVWPSGAGKLRVVVPLSGAGGSFCVLLSLCGWGYLLDDGEDHAASLDGHSHTSRRAGVSAALDMDCMAGA